MTTRIPTVLLLIGVALVSIPAEASHQFPYQGRLDKDGRPLNGQFDFRFALFDDATAGAQLWTETHGNVAVVSGAFSVKLGSVTTISDAVTATPALYLEISVKRGTDPYTQLRGRQQLLHVPFAAGTASNFRVGGKLAVNAPVSNNANAVINGGDNDGTSATLRIESGAQALLLDGNEVDSNGTLFLQGNSLQSTEVGGTLSVDGAATLKSSVTVTGATTLNGAATLNSANVTGALAVGGAATVSGNLAVTGDVTGANLWDRVYAQGITFGTAGVVVPVGSQYKVLKIYLRGFLQIDTQDMKVLIRPNSASSPYQGWGLWEGSASGADQETGGLYLGRSLFLANGEFSSEYTINCQSQSSYRFGQGTSNWSDATRLIGFTRLFSKWQVAGNACTSLQFLLQPFMGTNMNGSLTGELLIYGAK